LLNDEIEKIFNLRKEHNKTTWVNVLTRKTRDLSYKTEITLQKANWNKLWSPISNQVNVER
jgi:hypothetical protein